MDLMEDNDAFKSVIDVNIWTRKQESSMFCSLTCYCIKEAVTVFNIQEFENMAHFIPFLP